jgi:hypothetical protein
VDRGDRQDGGGGGAVEPGVLPLHTAPVHLGGQDALAPSHLFQKAPEELHGLSRRQRKGPSPVAALFLLKGLRHLLQRLVVGKLAEWGEKRPDLHSLHLLFPFH